MNRDFRTADSTKRSNNDIIKVSKEKKDYEAHESFEEIMVKIFPILEKYTNSIRFKSIESQ